MEIKMTFSTPPVSPKRAALYLRVSTSRQAAGDVSIPSQRDLTSRHCEAQNWIVTEEFIEPGASATDDRRPVFQRMLEQAKSKDRRFDIICVHAFSRFYRNGAEMEMTIRRLRKTGVEVVSVTQPTGDDPSQNLMRQIIGIFDEYTSKENGKNVSRAMRESAKQGFWNGASPPLGYRIVEAERRGAKIKKRLDIDPVDAELVRLIFKLYAEGDENSGPLGVKKTTEWLNAHGYRTRRGATFGIGPVHGILTNKCYASGKWPYGVKNSQTGALHDPSTIIEIDIPVILSLDLFERVQARLRQNNPKITPPRVVNGATLLMGLAVCASCGSTMTRSGTVRHNRSYTYYSCSGCQRKGKSVCKGRHIPVAKLDALVLDNLKQQFLQPERLGSMLGSLVHRLDAKDASVDQRRSKLETELVQKKEKLARLYKAIEDGIIDMDVDLKSRIVGLKRERDLVQDTFDRIEIQSANRSAITPEKIQAFSALLQDKLENGDMQARRAYLRSIISRIEIDDANVRIVGEKATLADVIAGRSLANGEVRPFVRKWCARQDSNLRPQD